MPHTPKSPKETDRRRHIREVKKGPTTVRQHRMKYMGVDAKPSNSALSSLNDSEKKLRWRFDGLGVEVTNLENGKSIYLQGEDGDGFLLEHGVDPNDVGKGDFDTVDDALGYTETIDDLKGGQPKTIDIYEDYWGMEGNVVSGKLNLRLGNSTDAGWYWSGDESDMVGYMSRIMASSITDEFIEKMESEGLTLDDFKLALLAAAGEGDGLYELSGDNRVWRFGEASDPAYESVVDGLQDDEPENIPNSLLEDWRNYVAENMTSDANFDDFSEKNGDSFDDDMVAIINESDNFKDYFERLRDVQNELYIDVLNYWENGYYESVESLTEQYQDTEEYKNFFKEGGGLVKWKPGVEIDPQGGGAVLERGTRRERILTGSAADKLFNEYKADIAKQTKL